MAQDLFAMLQPAISPSACAMLDFPRADRCDAAAWEMRHRGLRRCGGDGDARWRSWRACRDDARDVAMAARGDGAPAGFAEALAAMEAAARLGSGA
jgi:hypothetical protein